MARDRFFTTRRCDRCGRPLDGGRTMSMFNEQTICMDCADKERKRPDYEAARDAEIAAVCAGNRYFKGICRRAKKSIKRHGNAFWLKLDEWNALRCAV